MAFSLVGYQTVLQAGSSTITVDLSSLTGGTIAAGDVAYVSCIASMGTSSGHSYSASGFVLMGSLIRNPSFTNTTQVHTLEKSLSGSETTVTFTDGNSRGDTVAAVVAVYRGITAIGGGNFSAAQDPGSSSTAASPWQETNPTPTVVTIPSVAHALGTARQVIFYAALDMKGTGSIVRSSIAAELTERVSVTDTSNNVYVGWFDEVYQNAANIPSRAVSTHWSTGTGAHAAAMVQYRPTADQSVESEPGTEQDAWAWVG